MKTKKYVLKHREKDVALIELDEDYRLYEIEKIYDVERMPFGQKYRGYERAYIRQLGDWHNRRGINEGRRDFGEIQQKTGVNSGRELWIKAWGLNLTDHYWIYEKWKSGR